MAENIIASKKCLVFSAILVLFLKLVIAETQSSIGYDAEVILDQALNAIDSVSQEITDSITSFYPYEYDGHSYDIHNGGHDMYDGVANKVYHSNDEFHDVLYDYNLLYPNYDYGVRGDHPLFGLIWIRNKNEEYHTYRIQVEGYPGNGKDRLISTDEGSMELDNLKINYKIFQAYGTKEPSVCEVYFTVESEIWNSTSADAFSVMTFSKDASDLVNTVLLNGRPSQVFMGYLLLSTSTGDSIPASEVNNVLTILATPLLKVDMNERGYMENALLAVEATEETMRNAVGNWYNYSYTRQEIQNGGEDMYGRGGNKIYFTEDDASLTHLYYGLFYSYNNYQVTSKDTHPFFGLMWITNPSGEQHSYKWNVNSFSGTNEDGIISTFKDTIYLEDMTLRYNVFTLSGIRDHPSINEVYFVIENKAWNTNNLFELVTNFKNDTESLNNTIEVNGSPQNVLLGFMLLSKKSAMAVTESEASASMMSLAEEINKIKDASGDFLQVAIKSLESVAEEITKEIELWHEYIYDENFYKLSYEFNDMYNPWGNSIIFAEDLDDASYNRGSYGRYYNYDTFAVKSIAGHPFAALMWIDNPEFDFYSLKVHSHVDLYGNESYIYYNGSFSVMNTDVSYYVFQLYGRSQPSICEVYFTLSNSIEWSSRLSNSYDGYNFDATSVQDNYIYVGGFIERAFLGYTLFSRYPGFEAISKSDVQNSLSIMAQAITEELQATDKKYW